MLKAAIEKIQDLCAPHLFNIDGHHYLADNSGCYTDVKPDLETVECINLSSLGALVKFVKTEAVKRHEAVYITIPDHKTVECFTSIEQKIIEWSSGLHGKQRLSNNEIARRLGISPAAVSQRRNKIDRLMSEVREVL